MIETLFTAASLPAVPSGSLGTSARNALIAIVTLIVLAALLLVRTFKQKLELHHRHFRELVEREARLQLALWGSGEWLWEYAFDRRRLACRELAEFLGLRSGCSLRAILVLNRLVHPDDVSLVTSLVNALHRGEREIHVSIRMRGRGGAYRWIRWRGKVATRNSSGQPLTLIGTCKDVTSLYETEAEQRVGMQVLESVSDAIAVIDRNSRIMKVNPAFSIITGYSADEVVGKPVDFLCPPEDESLFSRDVLPALMRDGHWQGEHWKRHRSGRRYLSWSRVARINDGGLNDLRFVAVSSDVTERREYEQKLHFLANYDAMTGMLNRSSFLARLDQALARRNDQPVAVLFVDLDNFKQINDSYGHAVGDEVLRGAAGRLESILCGDEIIARFGGDEFVICLGRIRNAADAEMVAEKIVSAFRDDITVSCGSLIVTASVGVSLCSDDGCTSQQMVEQADMAMYQSKRKGRTTYSFYDGAMKEVARGEFELENQLRHALENDEFVLHYQPIVDVTTDTLTGMEALLRWNNPRAGLVLPNAFIRMAEERSLISEIGDWVLRRACREAAEMNAACQTSAYVSVNVSSLQVRDPEFAHRVRAALEYSQLAPELLQLELTESLILDTNPRILQTLKELRACGVQLALDDFGTGYSSLSYLRRFPIGRLKIDRTFVSDVPGDGNAASLVTTIIALAHLMQMDVTAEGVETVDQRNFLDRLGCRSQQGFHFASGMPYPEIVQLARKSMRNATVESGKQAVGNF